MPKFFQLVIFLFFAFNSSAQNKAVKAFIDHKNFFSPIDGPFTEIYFQFVGYTLKYKSTPEGPKANVLIGTTIINQRKDTVIKDAYMLESPAMRDSLISDFYEIQRYKLKPGIYTAILEILDAQTPKNESIKSAQIQLIVPENELAFTSDILIPEYATKSTEENQFVKSGYEIIPRLSNFYATEHRFLPYYFEIYNQPLSGMEQFGVKQSIIDNQTKKAVDGFTKFMRKDSAQVVPILSKIDMTALPTGSYTLQFDFIGKQNLVLSKPIQYLFERVNEMDIPVDIANIVLDPYFQASVTDDSLYYYLGSLLPISKPSQSRFLNELLKGKGKNIEECRKHLQQFWISTSEKDAAVKWNEYKMQVQQVQRIYGTNILAGYETDRGRVYLQYGAPNDIISREISVSEYPYEIWQYYKVKNYSNRRFIFYNPDLVNNNYRLLHSDMLGEVQNLRWQQALTKRNNADQNTDDPNSNSNDHYGGNSQYYYRQY